MARLCRLALLAALVLGTAGACDEASEAERLKRAEAFLDAGRVNGAVVELKELLQREPESLQGRLLLARAYLASRQLASAEKEFQRAKRLGADPVSVELSLARVRLRQGAGARVIEQLKPEPGWPEEARVEALQLRANAHLDLDEPERAAETFREALRLKPDDVESLVGLTRIALRQGNRQALDATLAQALSLAPDHPLLQRLQSGRFFAEGRYDDAVEGFRRQLAATPDSIVVRLALVQALMAIGQREEARAELARAMEISPRHPSAQYLHAVLDLQAGNYRSARTYSLLALAARPEHEPSILVAGIASYGLGRWRDARWHLDTLTRRGAYQEIARPLMAEIERRLEEEKVEVSPEAAALALRRDMLLYRLTDRALARAPAGSNGEAGTLLTGGFEALRQGRAAEAIPPIERAYRIAPGRLTLKALAVAHRQTGSPGIGRQLLENWLQYHADDAEIRQILADVYIYDGEPELALFHLRQLVSANPEDVIALNNLSWVLLRRGDAAGALGFAERAAALAPGDPRVLDTLGVAQLKSGDLDRSIEILRRASHSALSGPVVTLHLAEALYRKGELAEARSLLNALIASKQADAVHGAARNLLREIEG